METRFDVSEPSGRLLAAELRQLRELAGESGRALAKRIGISQPTVSRIETGASVPSLPVVMAWGRAIGISDATRDRLISLTEKTHNESSSWRTSLRHRGHLQDDVGAHEELARTIRVFQPSVVPGLLQTTEYARRIFSLFQVPYSTEDLAAAVAARLRRQAALYEGERQFEFLITEAALRWCPGPQQLVLSQWEQIAATDALENVSIGLIPSDATALTFTSHGFVIYESPDNDAFASVDTIHANIAVNDADDVSLYTNRWSLLLRMAKFGADAHRFLQSMADRLRMRGNA